MAPTPTASNGNGNGSHANGSNHATKPNADLLIAEQACRRILIKLQLISDSRAARLREGPRPPHYSESRVPEGVRLNGTITTMAAPSKQTSLWGHYSYRIERARGDAGELLKLAACATRDYEIYMRMRPAFHEKHDAAVTELLRDYTGVPAIEASWSLGAPLKWVQRQRVLHGVDAELGEPRKTDERTQRILDLKRSGKTVREVAEMVGMSTGYVSNAINGKAA